MKFPFSFFGNYGYTLQPFRMPKLKSHSGAKKRVYKTGSGKFAMKRNSRNHLLMQKAKRQKRLNRTLVVNPRDTTRLKALLPNL